MEDHGDDTYVELCLTVTDNQGLQDTACVDIKPQEVTYTFTTVPAGLPITYAGSRYQTPFKATTYVNAKRIVEAPATTPGGLAFAGWSDGGEAVHEVRHPGGSRRRLRRPTGRTPLQRREAAAAASWPKHPR